MSFQIPSATITEQKAGAKPCTEITSKLGPDPPNQAKQGRIWQAVTAYEIQTI